MIRYVALATAIVLGSILALLSVGKRATPESSPAPYSATVAPAGSPRPERQGLATARPLTGDAPWALSALPECFHQTRDVRGSAAYVRANSADLAPASWRRIRAARLATADCVLDVADVSAVVVRADTRLAIPPETRFFTAGHALVTDRHDGAAEDVRVYVLRDGKSPAFVAR